MTAVVRGCRGWTCAVAAVFCLAAGCATHDSLDMAQLLKDLNLETQRESGTSVPVSGSDAPEKPVSALPQRTLPALNGMDSIVSRSTLTIQPDCLVRVNIKEDPNLDGNYPVNAIGAIEMGYVGPVILYNKTEEEAEAKIMEILTSRDFRNATVKVKILRASYDRVEVGGAVVRPGVISIGAGDQISLNDAFLRAGGLRPSAIGAKIRIVRGGLTNALVASAEGEIYSLLGEDGEPTIPDVFLKNNDVLSVFSGQTGAAGGGEKAILVLGEVGKKGLYFFSGGEPCTMMHLVFKIGGLPSYAKTKAIRVIRRDDAGLDQEYKVNIDEILKEGDPEKDFMLENGDRVIVPARRISLF